MIEKSEHIPIKELIAVKFWYVLGLFTVVYLGVLIYDLIIGLNPASEYSVLIILGISAGIATIDLSLLLNNKTSPALIAMVLWISPFYALYKMFKKAELLNLDSTTLPRTIKQYTTQPIIRKVNFG